VLADNSGRAATALVGDFVEYAAATLFNRDGVSKIQKFLIQKLGLLSVQSEEP